MSKYTVFCLVVGFVSTTILAGCSSTPNKGERSIASTESPSTPAVSNPNTRPVKWR